MAEQVLRRDNDKTPYAWTNSVDVFTNGTRKVFNATRRRNSTYNDSDVGKNVYNRCINVKSKKDTFKIIKRFALSMNVLGVIICGSLLINRLSICLNK